MNPQELSLEQVKTAAREWYDNGRLTAQHPERLKRVCVYRSKDGYRCAIGASLSDETLDIVDQKEAVWMLHERDQIKISSADELHLIAMVQRRHDDWCQAPDDIESVNRPGLERAFLREIDHPTVADPIFS